MTIELELIAGLMFGVEYVDVPELEFKHVVVDLGFVRVLFSF
jgi:hypothetical protein